MKVQLLDLMVLLIYFAAIILIGVVISRRQAKGGREFFLAGGKMKWPFIGASLFAANISSQQFVGQAGLAFTVGIIAGGFQLIGAFCFMLLAVIFLRTYMGLKLTTAPEFFERRYDVRCRTIVSFINVMMVMLGNLTAAMYAGATVLSHLFGWDQSIHANGLFWLAVLVIGGTAGLYTLIGGLKAIMFCDFLQMMILMLGGALLLGFGISKVGSLSEVLAFTQEGTGSMWSLQRPWYHDLGWLPMLTGTFILGVHGHCTDQDYVQRTLSAGRLYHAKMGALFGGYLKILALFVIAAPGVVCAQLVMQGRIELITADSAYVALLSSVMPVGLMGLCLAGLVAAILSSVEAGLCACGSLLTYDFFSKIKKETDDHKQLKEGRVIMFVLLLLCMVMAPLIRHFEGLFHYLLYVWALLAPPVFVTVLFGLFDKRANAGSAFATLVTGCVFGLIAFVVLKLPFAKPVLESLPVYLQNKLNVGFVITLILAIEMFVLNRIFKPTVEDKQKVEMVRKAKEDVEPMTHGEAMKYRLFLAGLILFLLGVTVFFSPWGIGKQ
jgi:SSS family solute:Na+ symporter